MAGTAGYAATVKMSGTAVNFTDEACTVRPGTATANTEYRITDATKRVWSPATAVVVERDTGGGFTLVAATEYTLNLLDGTVTFDSDQGGSTAVQVTGAYLPLTTVVGAREASLELTRNLLDDTAFGGDGAVSRAAGLLDASGSLGLIEDLLGRYTVGDANSALSAFLRDGVVKVLEYAPTGSSTRLYRLFILFETASPSTPVADLLSSGLDFVLSEQRSTDGVTYANVALVTW